MIISVRLNDEDANLIKSYAEVNGVTLSELIRKAIMEKIEDEYDLKCYYESLEEYKKNPKTYSSEEVKKMMHMWDDEDEKI